MKYEHKTQYYETDQMGIIHHSNYIRWFEEARIDFMDHCGFSYAQMEKDGLISPVLSVSCEYKTMTHFGDTVEIETEITRYNSIKLETVLHSTGQGDRRGALHRKEQSLFSGS